MRYEKPLLIFPLICWLLFAFFTNYGFLTKTEISLHLLFFFYFGVFAVVFKALDFLAVLTACVVGTQISAVANLPIAPLVLFFVTGTAFSFWNRHLTSDEKAGKPRDAWQVWANGGLAFLVALISSLSHKDLKFLYLASVAIAISDTWSSELGMRFSRKTVDIRTWQSVPKGLSGGVSLVGLIAAVAGAMLISVYSNTLSDAVAITGFGVLGSVADSFIGSRFQAAYSNVGKLTDVPTGPPVKGSPWFTNDLVNIVSNTLITALAALFWFFR